MMPEQLEASMAGSSDKGFLPSTHWRSIATCSLLALSAHEEGVGNAAATATKAKANNR